MKRLADGAHVTTVEGMGAPGNLHPVQLAFVAHGAPQCGFCAPGFVISSKVLLDQNPDPTREEVHDWFQKNRNVCRCSGYKPYVDAIMDAARVLRGEMAAEDLIKMPPDGRLWGSAYPRPTAEAKVTGTIDYGADLGLILPLDVLHLALVQAKVSHANILSIDTSEAEQMPGVYKIVTHKDVKGKNRITVLKTLERVRGRIDGRVEIGSGCHLAMADLDEALFPIAGVLDFSALLTREGGRDRLHVEAIVVDGPDRATSSAVRRRLSAVPSIRSTQEMGRLDVCVDVRIADWDDEAARRLSKRKIVDRR